MKINKNLLVFLGLALLGLFLYQNYSLFSEKSSVPFSDFLRQVQSKKVSVAEIQGENIYFETTDQKHFSTVAPSFFPGLSDTLYKNGVKFQVIDEVSNSLFFNIFVQWLPIIVLAAIWIFFMRQMQSGGKLMGYARIKTRSKPETAVPVTFADVAGIEEAKQELEEVVDFLKDPQKFQNLGGRVPQGILLCGQPGTGKTLLARAIAGEAKVAFFNISGSDFVEMFVGVGASRVREVFEQARGSAPCIIFIDEIDAVGRHRGSGLGGGNDEREQTLNQLLVEMDGFKYNLGIIVIAATNRPDTLDPALTRPGRFDRTVIVPLPDKNGRKKILEIHARKVKIAADVNFEEVAQATPGFSGAELENLVNEAALLAGRQAKDFVFREDFDNAREKILLGSERKSLTITDKERESTAYHEAGHALIAALSSYMDAIHKVSIIPRGRALGITSFLPKDDKKMLTKTKLLAMLEMIMGGRAAEEIIYNHFTSGASNDLSRATEYAHRMVCNWGLSDRIGPLHLSDDNQEVFLGRDMVRRKKMSQETANIVDAEVNGIVNRAYQAAVDKLKANLDLLHSLAKLLLKEETLEGAQIVELVQKNLA